MKNQLLAVALMSSLALAGCGEGYQAESNVKKLALIYKANATLIKREVKKAAKSCSKNYAEANEFAVLPGMDAWIASKVVQRISIRADIGENASRDDEFGAALLQNMNAKSPERDPVAARFEAKMMAAVASGDRAMQQAVQKLLREYVAAEEAIAICATNATAQVLAEKIS